ncbi:MAG: hypothetical protein V1892_02600 [bacterium]
MDSNKLPRNIILVSILIIAVSIGYYYLIFLPQKERNRIEAENQKRVESIKNDCIDRVLKEMKNEHPKMETEEITSFRIASDRGCFIEAGCMKGVQDNYFKAKFDECNNEYYNTCLAGLKNKVDEMIEAEKLKRINECINLYSN